MSEMVASGSKYSDEDRLRAVVEYCVKGVMSKVSEATGIPKTTLWHWRRKSDWWDSLVEQVRTEKAGEFQAQLTRIIEKAHEETIDRLENGDEVHTKDGIKRMKMRGRDTATVGAIALDKLRLLLNQPNSIKADSSNIQALAQQFRELSEQWSEKQANVVSAQRDSQKIK